MADMRSIFNSLRDVLGQVFKELPENEPIKVPNDQSVSIQNLYEQVWNASMTSEEWMWLIDLYVDESSGTISALFAKEGKLFMAPVTLDVDGAILGEMIQVVEIFEPVKNTFRIKQMKDGSVRWFLLASSTVLNRMGYFNTKSLFDNMNKRAQDTGEYPYLTFYHLGESMKMGTTDWVARDDNILLASGVYYDDDWLADVVRKAQEREPEYWGSSISFWPYEKEKITVSEGVTLDAYTDGEYEEISILPEQDACALLTAMISQRKVESAMDARVKDALSKLADGDEELLDKLIERSDSANAKIQNEGLLHQSSSGSKPEIVAPVVTITQESESSSVEEPSQDSEPAQTSDQTREVEIDDSLVDTIVERLVNDPRISQSIEDLRTSYDSLNQSLLDFQTAISERIDQLSLTLTSTDQRIKVLEKPVEEIKKEVVQNLSRGQTRTRVVVRPSEQNANVKKDSRSIAEETLQNIR